MRQIKPNVVAEEMDGELLAIDDATGTYVAVRGAGLWLWKLLCVGTPPENIKAALESSSVGTDGHDDVDGFIAQLEEAGLLVDCDEAPAPPVPDPPTPWSRPEVEKYDDLQDLLLLDPIHEVSDAGWPRIGSSD